MAAKCSDWTLTHIDITHESLRYLVTHCVYGFVSCPDGNFTSAVVCVHRSLSFSVHRRPEAADTILILLACKCVWSIALVPIEPITTCTVVRWTQWLSPHRSRTFNKRMEPTKRKKGSEKRWNRQSSSWNNDMVKVLCCKLERTWQRMDAYFDFLNELKLALCSIVLAHRLYESELPSGSHTVE